MNYNFLNLVIQQKPSAELLNKITIISEKLSRKLIAISISSTLLTILILFWLYDIELKPIKKTKNQTLFNF